jgi:hypothetical protein
MAREWLPGGSVERTIDAPADVIYRVVTDVAATRRLSDECRRAEWLDGDLDEAVVGARFRGHNRIGPIRWSRVCEVIEARPDAAFAFRTVPERWDPSRRDSTIWRYDLEPSPAGGTTVRHSYEVAEQPLRPFKAVYGRIFPHHRDMRPAMRHTLDALAAAVESDAAASVPT